MNLSAEICYCLSILMYLFIMVVTANKSAAKSEWAERTQGGAGCLFAPLKIHHLALILSALSFLLRPSFCLDFLSSDFVHSRTDSHSLIFRVAGPDNFDGWAKYGQSRLRPPRMDDGLADSSGRRMRKG